MFFLNGKGILATRFKILEELISTALVHALLHDENYFNASRATVYQSFLIKIDKMLSIT